MEIIPFNLGADSELNEVCVFHVRSESDPDKIYNVTLTIDPLNDSLLINKECTCPGNFQGHHECKHIKFCIEELKKYKEFRQYEMGIREKTD